MRRMIAAHSSGVRSMRMKELPCWWQNVHCVWKCSLVSRSPRSSAPSQELAGRASASFNGSVSGTSVTASSRVSSGGLTARSWKPGLRTRYSIGSVRSANATRPAASLKRVISGTTTRATPGAW